MSLLGGGQQSTKTKVKLTPEQKALAAKGSRDIINWANANPTYTPPSTSAVAPFNETQKAAQEAALGAAPQQANVATNAGNASNFLFNDVLSPDSNQYLKQYADYATEPLMDQGYKLLSAARGGADATGGYGGTRQGLVEARAINDTIRNIGGTRANIFNDAYGKGLDAMVKALALAPQTQGLYTQPAKTIGAVGDVRQAQEQALLNE